MTRQKSRLITQRLKLPFGVILMAMACCAWSGTPRPPYWLPLWFHQFLELSGADVQASPVFVSRPADFGAAGSVDGCTSYFGESNSMQFIRSETYLAYTGSVSTGGGGHTDFPVPTVCKNKSFYYSGVFADSKMQTVPASGISFSGRDRMLSLPGGTSMVSEATAASHLGGNNANCSFLAGSAGVMIGDYCVEYSAGMTVPAPYTKSNYPGPWARKYDTVPASSDVCKSFAVRGLGYFARRLETANGAGNGDFSFGSAGLSDRHFQSPAAACSAYADLFFTPGVFPSLAKTVDFNPSADVTVNGNGSRFICRMTVRFERQAEMSGVVYPYAVSFDLLVGGYRGLYSRKYGWAAEDDGICQGGSMGADHDSDDCSRVDSAAIRCSKQGVPVASEFEKTSMSAPFSPVAVTGIKSECPDDRTFTVMGSEIRLSFEAACSTAPWLKPLVLLVAASVCGWFVYVAFSRDM